MSLSPLGAPLTWSETLPPILAQSKPSPQPLQPLLHSIRAIAAMAWLSTAGEADVHTLVIAGLILDIWGEV